MKRFWLTLYGISLLLAFLIAVSLAEPAQPCVAQVTTEKGTLNLRKSPDAKAGILERIPNHSLVLVVSQADDYWQITYDDKTGYAAHDYLTVTDFSQDVLQYRVLYRDNQGDDVLALKNRLLALGYYREGSSVNNLYNDTCVERVKIFERVNGLTEDGIATEAVQALLYSDKALTNTEPLPAPKTSGYVIADSSSSSSNSDIDWNQWMLDNPGVCPCCKGAGCACCDWTGKI